MRGMGRIWKVSGIVCLLLWMMAVLVCASPVTVTGQGSTERNALHDAMGQAIEQQIGVLIDSRTYVENYQVINDRIYTQSAGYIESYEVLQSGSANGLWQVTITAQVRSEALRTDLMSKLQKKALIGANMQDPRIGVLAVDSEGMEYDGLENEIISGLQNQGFSRLVDLNQIEASVRKRLASADATGDASLRDLLVNQFHVDYMVTAKVSMMEENGLGKIIRQVPLPDDNPFLPAVLGNLQFGAVQANVAVRMLNMNTGEIIYAGSFSEKSGSGSNAASKALAKISPQVVSAVSKAALEKAANPEQHVTVLITNGRLGTMSQAYQWLSNLPGVHRVFTRSTSQGTIQVDVDYDGTAYDLASEIERNGISILEMNSEYVKI